MNSVASDEWRLASEKLVTPAGSKPGSTSSHCLDSGFRRNDEQKATHHCLSRPVGYTGFFCNDDTL